MANLVSALIKQKQAAKKYLADERSPADREVLALLLAVADMNEVGADPLELVRTLVEDYRRAGRSKSRPLAGLVRRGDDGPVVVEWAVHELLGLTKPWEPPSATRVEIALGWLIAEAKEGLPSLNQIATRLRVNPKTVYRSAEFKPVQDLHAILKRRAKADRAPVRRGRKFDGVVETTADSDDD